MRGTTSRGCGCLLDAWGLMEQVEWLGWLPQSEVLRHMREADVFLFPSLHEEAGVAVAEARAAGLPIVCLARGGPPLLAGPGGICVADSGDVHAVAARLADAALTSLLWRREQEGPVRTALMPSHSIAGRRLCRSCSRRRWIFPEELSRTP